MKIEINLDDVLRDEFGGPEESLEESVRRQVVDRLTVDYRKRLFAKFDDQLAVIMNEQLAKVMESQMPALIDDIMNSEYTPVSTFGQRAEKTTFRDEIIKSVAANMVYKPKQYSSEENPFTQAVRSVVDAQTNELKKELTAQIDTKFRADAIAYAVKELSVRLGLDKK